MTHPRYAVCLFGLLYLFCAGHVQAKPQPTPKELAQLAERVDTANRLFEEKNYKEALPVYQDVYNRSKEPTMLFSMGQCHRNLRQYKEAANAYQTFLEKAPEDNELRPLAQQLLAEVEAKLPKETEAPTKARGQARTLYLAAAATGAASLSLGATSIITIISAGKQQDQGDIDAANNRADAARRFAVVADVTAAASLGLAIGGFVLSTKEKKTTASLYLGPSMATLRLEF